MGCAMKKAGRASVGRLAVIIAIAGSCAPVPLLAQRTEENAVTQSGDAFGRSVGSERVGLYNQEDVRGFDPIDAGNARIEGLYFDQQDRVPQRLQSGSVIRVGISAQRYPFPAPTGIVDYALTLPGERALATIEMERGPFGGFAGALEVEIPIANGLGIAGGVGGRNQIRPEGGRNRFRNFGAVIQWQPSPDARLIAFGGGYSNAGDEARPTLFLSGDALPVHVPRQRYLGQDWAERNNLSRTFGLIANLPLGAFRIDAGLFRSSRLTGNAFADILTGVTPDGRSAARFIIADGNNEDRSLSGEVRLSRSWQSGAFSHKVAVSLRGRDKQRLFGGTQRIALGPSSAIAPDPRPRPLIGVGPESRDTVEQLTYGAAYSLDWQGRGSVDLSLSRSRYRKAIDFADLLRPDIAVRDDPWLATATASLILARRLALYGGYVRGLEEAPIAPEIAINRNEAPPATRTRQMDFGLRYAVSDHMNFIAGLFSVKKPYFNLDASNRFRELGGVDNRGVEVSLAGSVAPGWSLVAGSIFIDPKIAGEAVRTRQIGDQPVGSLRRRSIINLDWRPAAGHSPLSLDFALESLSARMANAANTLEVGPREALNVGGRYRFAIGSHKALLRGQVTNLFNDYGWQVSSSGGFTASSSRTWTLQLVADI
jgi:iron complex outermembrane receptor protein